MTPSMQPSGDPPRRGRPRRISRERIAEAGKRITLPEVTVVGVAAELGVSHVGLYKHVAGLEELKVLIADEIFAAWTMPAPARSPDIAHYLHVFTESLYAVADENPGLAQFLARPTGTTPRILAGIRAHHEEVARAFGLEVADAGWLLSTVALHCVALAATAYPSVPQDKSSYSEFRRSMHALIVGALATVGEPSVP